MKKCYILASLLALTACSGGITTGSGSASLSFYTVNDIETRRANVDASSMVDNGTKREEHIAKMYAAAGESVPINDNGSLNIALNRGGSHGHNNGVSQGAVDLFENMHEWCSGDKMADFYNLFPDGMTESEINDMLAHTSNLQGLMNSLRHALVLAGYGLEIKNQGNHYVIHLIKDHESEIKEQANEIYDQMGQFQEFDIRQAELAVDGDTIHFLLDDNNKINGVLYTENAGQADREAEYILTKQDNADIYDMNVTKYVYGIPNVDVVSGHDFEPMHSHDATIEINTPLELNEIKTRLLAEIDHLHNDEHYFHNFHTVQQTDRDWASDNCTVCDQDDLDTLAQDYAATRMYNAAIARVNALTQSDIEGDDFIHTQENEIGHMKLETFGKNVGLAFADFGKMHVSDDINDFNNNDYAIVYGGYANKLINPANFADNSTKTFTGTVIGKADNSLWENGEDEEKVSSAPIALYDNNAQLVFQHGANNTETLTASFDNWYDMAMVKTGETANLTFTNYSHTDDNDNPDNSYRFLGDLADINGDYNNSYTINNFTQTHQINFIGDDSTGNSHGSVDVQYYGMNSTPSEAVGLVAYNESEPMGNAEDYIKSIGFEIGFGMTKDYIENP